MDSASKKPRGDFEVDNLSLSVLGKNERSEVLAYYRYESEVSEGMYTEESPLDLCYKPYRSSFSIDFHHGFGKQKADGGF